MILQDYRDAYYAHSKNASDTSRQLCFAGIAVIWLFRDPKGGPIAVPIELFLPTSLFVFALALDLFQYVAATAIWGFFARYHERLKKSEDQELSSSKYLNWPALGCFWGKLFLVLLAYVFLFRYAIANVTWP
jgi:hypothetical protein